MNRVVVIGDLAVDYVIDAGQKFAGEFTYPPMELGGTAVNAAKALSVSAPISPIVLGLVGCDPEGDFVHKQFDALKINAVVSVDQNKRTGSYLIVNGDAPSQRIIIKNDCNNANTYEPSFIAASLNELKLTYCDYALLMCHFVTRLPVSQSLDIFRTVANACDRNHKVVWDLVPHNMFNSINYAAFSQFCDTRPYAIIGEWETLLRLLQIPDGTSPSNESISGIHSKIKSDWLIIRFGEANIEFESRYHALESQFRHHSTVETGFNRLNKEERRGFGDLLTTRLFESVFLLDKQSPT